MGVGAGVSAANPGYARDVHKRVYDCQRAGVKVEKENLTVRRLPNSAIGNNIYFMRTCWGPSVLAILKVSA